MITSRTERAHQGPAVQATTALSLAGSTVVLSLLGLFLLGLPFIYGAALGAIIAVLMAKATFSLTEPARPHIPKEPAR